MDVVFIKGLEVQTVIGAYDWERNLRQSLIFDVEMGTDVRPAAATDNLDEAKVDYAAVASTLTEFVESSSYELIETLADRLVNLLIDEFELPWIRLTVHKPRPKDRFTAGLMLERGSRVQAG